jgi:hypothetical protein
MHATLLACGVTGLTGALTDLNQRNWSATAHCTEGILRLHWYLKDQGTDPNPLAVRLEVHRVVGSDGLVLLHIEDNHPLLDVEDSGDNCDTL